MQPIQRRRLTWLPFVVALGLVAAACGSDNDGDSTEAEAASGSGAAASAAGIDYSTCSGEITGSGASFPDAAYQEVITELADVAPDLIVTYNAIGSGSGKEEFGNNLNDFAGTDSLVAEDDGPAEGSYVYVPTVAASVAAAYNLPGVDRLNLRPDDLARIFQREITRWDDPTLAEHNPDVELPNTEIVVARRADGSGTTKNFTTYLEDAAPDVWKLGSDDTVEWPADTQAGQQNTGVAQIIADNEGAIGYVDLGDAQATGLQVAAVQNREGNFVLPSVEGTQAALAAAELSDDLTYDPLNGPGEDAYPITAPTYILVRTDDDPATTERVRCFLTFLLTDGADVVTEVGFAPLPDEMRERALAELDQL